MIDDEADLSPVEEFVSSGPTRFVFNLENLTLIDGDGMLKLNAFYNRLTGKGFKAAAYGTNSVLAGLFTIFPAPEEVLFCGDEAEALEIISNS